MAPVQSKERKAAALFLMASSSFECRPDRHQKTVCTRLAPHSSHKLPRLIEVIFVGSGAKQKRSWHGQGEPELASWKKTSNDAHVIVCMCISHLPNTEESEFTC